MEDMQTITLHFSGPLTFMPGDRSIFHYAHRDAPCVYLWTIRSDLDGDYYIHYVGKALSFAKRRREHLVQILELNYGIFYPVACRQGMDKRVWSGLWRDKSQDGPGLWEPLDP